MFNNLPKFDLMVILIQVNSEHYMVERVYIFFLQHKGLPTIPRWDC